MFLRATRTLPPLSRARLRRALCAAALAALCCAAANAQSGADDTGTGGRHTIQGRIFFPSGRRADARLKVRLRSSQSGELSIFADSNGSFTFRSLEAGYYTVVVEGGDDFETVSESIYIEQDVNNIVRGAAAAPVSRPYTVQVYLQPKRRGGDASKSGVLDASLAGVPKPAVELYNKALDSMRAGHDDRAVEQFKAAVEVDHDFALALSGLGIAYMKLKRPDEAVEPLRAALRLKPDDFVTLVTYGTALFDRGQLAEAEEQFGKALRKTPGSPTPHYYVGLLLLKRHDLDGGERELRRAVELGGDEMALAHYYLGGIYWGKRDYKRAATELETYLRLAPNAEDAPRTRAAIKELRSKK